MKVMGFRKKGNANLKHVSRKNLSDDEMAIDAAATGFLHLISIRAII
jgi:hypothetical protein